MTDGRTLADGRYLLGAPLGRGGMAEVSQGLDQRLNRPVAVKQLSAALAADPTALTRFRREAQAAASLNHPTIAAVFDTGEEPDPATGVQTPYIVMELVEGRTLRRVLSEDGPLPSPRALQITVGVLDALEHSHTAGIIHRDIKPANVMLTGAGAVKVMDFGIARTMDDTSASLTQTSTVIGTAQYLSPEQAAGLPVDRRSDLYSVGCLLYELLVGRPPFVGETPISIAYQHVREAPVPPSSLVPGLDPAIDAVVLTALAKEPEARYQDAPAMRADVERVLAGLPPTATPESAIATVAAATRAVPQPTAPVPVLAPAPVTETVATPAATVVAPPRRGAGGRRAALIALAVFLILGLGAFGLTRLLAPGGVAAAASVGVPDVMGRTRAQADAALRKAGLVPKFTEVRGKSGKTVNRVVKQTPPSGNVATGSVVVLAVNVGPATQKLPGDLVGADVEDAERELARAGFTHVRTQATDDGPGDAAAGTVVSVRPREGQAVALDEEILLRYTNADDSGSGSDGRDQGSARQSTGSGGSGPQESESPTSQTSSDPTRSESPDSTTSSAPTTKPSSTPSPTASSSAPEPTSSTSTAGAQTSKPAKSSPPSHKPKPSKKPKDQGQGSEVG